MVALVLLTAIVPIVYVLALPYLATQGFAHPRCSSKGTNCRGAADSVSGYIATPRATGAMAAAFFPAFTLAWINALYRQYSTMGIVSLGVFHVAFSAFLVCTVDWVPSWHYLTVLVFCIAACVHFVAMGQSPDSMYSPWPVRAVIFTGAAAFGSLGVQSFVSRYLSTELFPNHPKVFWAVEVIGLSAFVLYVPMLLLMQQKREISKAVHPFVQYFE
jgi:hypothetical protein